MNKTPDESLNRLTTAITRAGGISDDDVERMGSSPFIRARVLAGIEAERRRRVDQGSGWLSSLLVASRAIAVLLVVTIAAVVTFWLSKSNASNDSVSVSPAETYSDDISRVVTGGTCALSATDECAISTEEVLATLFADKAEEEPK